MAAITAIELGPDTCAFAGTSGRGGEIRLLASEILDPAAYPGPEAFAVAVRRTRRTFRLPRRCRVVVWGLPDGANLKDAAVKPVLKPLADAGFRVERVVTPCNALAALSRLKTSRADGSACWVAINRGGVAIVAVRPGRLLHAHSFAWDSTAGATGSQARLLQRYLLVSHLSPHVKRAMAEARKAGSPVNVVVTCGNLPDLRSLTMPLIEELDVEVETLDSLEGLVVKPEVVEKLAETAPAIRLACAAVIARGSRPWDPSKKKKPSHTVAYVAAAIVAALLAGLGYQWYVSSRAVPVAPAPPSQPVRTPPPPASGIEGRDSRAGKPGNGPRSSVLDPGVPAPKSNPPAVNVPAAPPKANPAAVSLPPLTIEAPRTSVLEPRVQTRSTPAVPAPPAQPPATALHTPPVPADKPEAGSAATSAVLGVSRRAMAAPLLDAFPKVTAILVSPNRRYATIAGGRIIGIGDRVGRRTVVDMDERSVLFEEPSGVQIRIGLGGRLLAGERDVR